MRSLSSSHNDLLLTPRLSISSSTTGNPSNSATASLAQRVKPTQQQPKAKRQPNNGNAPTSSPSTNSPNEHVFKISQLKSKILPTIDPSSSNPKHQSFVPPHLDSLEVGQSIMTLRLGKPTTRTWRLNKRRGNILLHRLISRERRRPRSNLPRLRPLSTSMPSLLKSRLMLKLSLQRNKRKWMLRLKLRRRDGRNEQRVAEGAARARVGPVDRRRPRRAAKPSRQRRRRSWPCSVRSSCRR